MSLPLIPHDTTFPVTAILGSWIEGPLYGINVAVFAMCVRTLIKDDQGAMRRVLLVLAALQLLLATAHMTGSMVYMLQGFVHHANAPGGPTAFLADTSTSIYCAQLVLYLTNHFIGDSILAWRCFVVWGHNKLIGWCYTVLILATMASGYTAVAIIRLKSPLLDIFIAKRWVTSWLSLSLTTQITTTFLIALRIWYSRSPLNRQRQMSIIWMMVESGVILTASTMALLILFDLNFNAGQICQDINAQLSCLVPMSIVVRAGMRRNLNYAPRNAVNGNNILLLDRSRETRPFPSTLQTYSADSGAQSITDNKSVTLDPSNVLRSDV